MEQNNDPYPLPSGVPVSSTVTVRLNDSNYLLWKPQLEALLFSQKLLGFVTGQEARPPATVAEVQGDAVNQIPNPRLEAWNYTDQLVRSWLFSTLSEEVLGCVVGFTTSREIWTYLGENYNRRTVARVFELRRNLQMLTKKGKSFNDYCKTFRSLCDQLSSIGEPVEDSMKIFTFLNGLGRDYDPVTTVIQNSLSRIPMPTFNEVVAEVSGFDNKLQSYEDTPEVLPHLAFEAYKSENNNTQRGRGRYNRGRSGYSSRGRGFSQQVSSRNSYDSDSSRPICQICGKVGHVALKCYNRFNNNYQATDLPQALAAVHVSDFSGNEWLPDSGASAHITPHTSGLRNMTAFNGSENIIVADGNSLPITHVGSTTLASTSGSIPLNDVLVCPSIKHSLLSISKLCEDHPCAVYFDDEKVLILERGTSKVLTKGNKRNGLYVLDNPDFLALYSNRQRTVSSSLWHCRLGHANKDVIQHLIKNEDISVNKEIISSVCEPCQMAKSSSLPFFSSESKSVEPLSLVFCDLWGPSPLVSFQGFKYYALFVDDFSRFTWLFPLKFKSDFYDVFLRFQLQVENQFSRKIKVFQTDGGGEFTNQKLLNHLANHGIRHRMSCPHTPQQNGSVERKHRNIVEIGLSMLYHSQVPLQYWVEAFFTANEIINLLPSQPLHNKSPHEVLFQHKPEYSHLRVFGCGVYPCLRPYTAHKLEPRSLLCVFLGYNQKYKGYRCLYPPTGRVFITRNAIFDEELFPFKDRYKDQIPRYSSTMLQSWQASYLPAQLPAQVSVNKPQVFTKPAFINTHIENVSTMADNSAQDSSTGVTESDVNTQTEESSSSREHTEEVAAAPTPLIVNQHPMQTRGKDGIQKPNPRYLLMTNLQQLREPQSVQEALAHKGWTEACLEELDTMDKTQTYDLVPQTDDMNVLNCRWVFKLKLNANGDVDRLRARLVAKGFQQSEGVDYLETFSPVVRSATIRTVLNVAVSSGWQIKQLDVKNAFLHGDLSEPVFMHQPPGFVNKEKPSHVCRLKKAIYGLKQAPRAWFDKFSHFLLEFGFKCSMADPSLFTYHQSGTSLALLLYVDDIILTGNNNDRITELIGSLNHHFMMKDLGPLHYFLGMQAEFNENGLFLHQSRYATEILELAAMNNCNPMATPLLVQNLHVPQGSNLFSDATYFRSLAGKLQYLTLTRPDLQFSVNLICQRMHAPTNQDFSNLKRILRYIKGTSTFGLHITKQSSLSLQA